MTDFSPNRPHRWPAYSVKAYEVYRLGETEADIREGQDFPKTVCHMALRLVDGRNGHPDRCGERRDGGGQLYDPDGDADRRGRQVGARGVGTGLEEPHRAHGGDDDAFIGPRFLSSYYNKV